MKVLKLTHVPGILKNSGSYQNTSPEVRTSPNATELAPDDRPGMPARELSEKEITQMNTNINAGTSSRRNSSNPRRGSSSRRQSNSDGMHDDEAASPRLKWDEANLYLNEGQMGGRMKIDEPKTPYAAHYDPAEDDEDAGGIDPNALVVDELDKVKGEGSGSTHTKAKTDDIPGLDIGEPEMEDLDTKDSEGERRVIVDQMDVDGAHHGEDMEDMSKEEREKHRKFEEMRKKHYEMRNVKGLLG